MIAEAIVSYLVAAMMSFVPVAEHAYLEKPEVTRERYASIARDLGEAGLEAPIFSGASGGERTALLLASLAGAESHYAQRTDECRPAPGEGDRDKDGNPHAWTIFQMHIEHGRTPPKWLLCSSRPVAVRAAREWVRESFRICKHLDQADRLSFYTDGVCKPNWKRSRFRVERAVAWAKVHEPPIAEPVAER